MGIGGSVTQGREYRHGVHPLPVMPCRCGKRWWGGYLQVRWCEPGYEEFELLRLGIRCMDTLPDFEAAERSLAWAPASQARSERNEAWAREGALETHQGSRPRR